MNTLRDELLALASEAEEVRDIGLVVSQLRSIASRLATRDELLPLVTEVEGKEADIEQRMKELSETIVRLRMIAERVKAEEAKTISGSIQDDPNSYFRQDDPNSYFSFRGWRP